MVNPAAPSVAASAGSGSHDEAQIHHLGHDQQAASEPAATPTSAVASPISRYSSA